MFNSRWRRRKVKPLRPIDDSRIALLDSEYAPSRGRLTRRLLWEENQLKSVRDSIADLRSKIEKGENLMSDLENHKAATENDLLGLQKDIDRQRKKLGDAASVLEAAVKKVQECRDAASKAHRLLDQALKEIGNCNDEIERAASDRHAIYRRCRLEEIDLPVKAGRLDKVPIEEVRDEGGAVLLIAGQRHICDGD